MQLVVVAGLVVMVSQLLAAYAYEVSVQLSVFIGLIITNCILMEQFAEKCHDHQNHGIANAVAYAVEKRRPRFVAEDLAVSKNVKTALGLGAAVTFMLVITLPINYLLETYVLKVTSPECTKKCFATRSTATRSRVRSKNIPTPESSVRVSDQDSALPHGL